MTKEIVLTTSELDDVTNKEIKQKKEEEEKLLASLVAIYYFYKDIYSPSKQKEIETIINKALTTFYNSINTNMKNMGVSIIQETNKELLNEIFKDIKYPKALEIPSYRAKSLAQHMILEGQSVEYWLGRIKDTHLKLVYKNLLDAFHTDEKIDIRDIMEMSSRLPSVRLSSLIRTYAVKAQSVAVVELKNKLKNTQLRWITRNDNLVCPICVPLHNKVVSYNFPPAHWGCRCYLQLEVLER